MTKRKTKFKSSEDKRRSEELAQSWEKLMSKYEPKKSLRVITKPKTPVVSEVFVRETPNLPSRVTPGGSTGVKEAKKYTGTEVLGISIVHKSCLQPIFSEQGARDVAAMRR